MIKIIDFAIKKAKTTLLIAFMVIIAGSYARQEIPIAASPNVQLPFENQTTAKKKKKK